MQRKEEKKKSSFICLTDEAIHFKREAGFFCSAENGSYIFSSNNHQELGDVLNVNYDFRLATIRIAGHQ